MHRLTNTNVPRRGEWKNKAGKSAVLDGGQGTKGERKWSWKKGGGGSEGGVGVSNLLWILVSHLISGVVHRGATGVTPVLLTIVDYCRRCSHLMLVTQWGAGLLRIQLGSRKFIQERSGFLQKNKFVILCTILRMSIFNFLHLQERMTCSEKDWH